MTAQIDRSTARPTLRSVAVPSEHGGWSLTLEPVLLGLLVSWSVAGLALGAAAVGAFIMRTPLKVVLVDVWRQRWLARTTLALQVLLAELVIVGGLVLYAGELAGYGFMWPGLIALPLIGFEMWFDMRSRSRRLLPELAGSIGIGAAAAAIVIAGGSSVALAFGLWAVMAVRSVAAIPYVRYQILRTKKRVMPLWQSDASQGFAVAAALIARMIWPIPTAAVVIIAVIGLLNVVAARLAPRRATYIGIEQVAHGLAVVLITAAAL